MPELPDIELYISCLRTRILGEKLISFRTYTPFVLRSVTPSPKDLEGQAVTDLRRLGKRIAIGFERSTQVHPGDSSELITHHPSPVTYLIVHLMIAGRLRWMEGAVAKKKPGGRIGQASLEFENGTLFLTEAGSKKRASLTIVQGEDALKAHDPGGIEVFEASFDEFRDRLQSENHTVKRSLANPHLFSGIGNAYSDEILHVARLSPMKLTQSLSEEQLRRLFEATRQVLMEWTNRLREQFRGKFPGPGDVTAFRPEFAVHGKYGQPCPACGKAVQRICYADNEANYCAVCQNDGRMLADRALSRLLKDAWPDRIAD